MHFHIKAIWHFVVLKRIKHNNKHKLYSQLGKFCVKNYWTHELLLIYIQLNNIKLCSISLISWFHSIWYQAYPGKLFVLFKYPALVAAIYTTHTKYNRNRMKHGKPLSIHNALSLWNSPRLLRISYSTQAYLLICTCSTCSICIMHGKAFQGLEICELCWMFYQCAE